MSPNDILHRFKYHRPDAEKAERHQLVRDQVLALATVLNAVLPDGREASLAITKLEEVMFWSNAAVARS
jgi:hypothetical protein